MKKTRYFTQYLTNDTWTREAQKVLFYTTKKKMQDGRLNHSAGGVFRSKGISVGDVVYVITVKDGVLRLGGKITVEDVLGQKQAAVYLKTTPEKLWEAKDHLVMPLRKAKYFTPYNEVSRSVVRKLVITSASGTRGVKMNSNGRVDSQTLRGVCELTEASAKLLDKCLGDGEKFPQRPAGYGKQC